MILRTAGALTNRHAATTPANARHDTPRGLTGQGAGNHNQLPSEPTAPLKFVEPVNAASRRTEQNWRICSR
jgi:hypothetical protein